MGLVTRSGQHRLGDHTAQPVTDAATCQSGHYILCQSGHNIICQSGHYPAHCTALHVSVSVYMYLEGEGQAEGGQEAHGDGRAQQTYRVAVQAAVLPHYTDQTQIMHIMYVFIYIYISHVNICYNKAKRRNSWHADIYRCIQNSRSSKRSNHRRNRNSRSCCVVVMESMQLW
jgi:hypothetical protein